MSTSWYRHDGDEEEKGGGVREKVMCLGGASSSLSEQRGFWIYVPTCKVMDF